MFNEITLKDIETIDTLISERNKSLHNKMIFLSWTFPTNHSHETQRESSNYFCIWVGRTGKMSLKLVLFGGIWMLPKLLSEITDEQFFEILDRNEDGYERV